MTEQDPFEDPTPRVSAFASADSFRGRLVMIEPTRIEHDIPKQASNPSGPKGDRITANVTVMDGKGAVQIFNQKVPTGRFLDGPLHRGVWFNQDQITQGLQTPDGALRKRVLAKLDTLKPGTPAGQGNPWVMNPATPEEKAQAAKLLAEGIVGAAAAAAPVNPFETKQPPF